MAAAKWGVIAMTKSKNYERNLKVLEALRNAGADSNKEHSIEHHLYCYSEDDYNLLMNLGKTNGYRVAYEGKEEDEDGTFWQLDLVKSTKPTFSTIEAQSKEIESFAEQAKADYDGWGTEVES